MEAAITSYFVTGDFLQYIYSVPVIKNHKNIRWRCLVHEFFHHRYFLTILIMFTEQLQWRKILCGCFRFIWLWLLISIMKRCAERCAMQLHHRYLLRIIIWFKVTIYSQVDVQPTILISSFNRMFLRIIWKNLYWKLDVSWTASYEMTPVRLCVRLSVCLPVRQTVHPSVRD